MGVFSANRFSSGLKSFLIVFGAGYTASNCIYTVEAGHRAIVFNKLTGLGDKVYTEGTHFRIPYIHRPIIFDVRTKPRLLTSLTGSRDLQMVNITCRVLSRPNEFKLSSLYRHLGLDYDEKVLPSIINEVLKSVVAQYNASQLITQREIVSKSVRDQLVKRAKEFGIVLDDVALTHLSFSSEYEKAVESKQVAQQQAEKAKYIVQRALEEKNQLLLKHEENKKQLNWYCFKCLIIYCQIGEAVKENPGFVELRRLECAREISTVLSQSTNKILLNTNTLLLDLWRKDI